MTGKAEALAETAMSHGRALYPRALPQRGLQGPGWRVPAGPGMEAEASVETWAASKAACAWFWKQLPGWQPVWDAVPKADSPSTPPRKLSQIQFSGPGEIVDRQSWETRAPEEVGSPGTQSHLRDPPAPGLGSQRLGPCEPNCALLHLERLRGGWGGAVPQATLDGAPWISGLAATLGLSVRHALSHRSCRMSQMEAELLVGTMAVLWGWGLTSRVGEGGFQYGPCPAVVTALWQVVPLQDVRLTWAGNFLSPPWA